MMEHLDASRLGMVFKAITQDKDAQEKLINIYGEHDISFWFRKATSDFIEERKWCATSDPDDASCQRVYSEFIRLAEEAIGQLDNAFKEVRKSEELNKIKNRYCSDPKAFVAAMEKCVETEYEIIGCEQGSSLRLLSSPLSPYEMLGRGFEELTSGVKSVIHNNKQPECPAKRLKVEDPERLITSFAEVTEGAVEKQMTVHQVCFYDLEQWHREQNMMKYKELDSKISLKLLDEVQTKFCDTYKECDKMIETINPAIALMVHGVGAHQWVSKGTLENIVQRLTDAVEHLENIKRSLEAKSVVIEEQPPRIIEIKDRSTKPNDSFRIKLRPLLDIDITGVKVEMLNEDDFRSSRVSSATVKFNELKHGDSLILDEIKIKDFKRPTNQNVLFKPYAFQLEVSAQSKGPSGASLNMKVFTDDCILGSHTQLSKGQGYLLWSWAFSTMDPFSMREEVTWQEFLDVLSSYFYKETHFLMNDDNFQCLALMFKVAERENKVTLEQLLMEPSPHSTKLTREDKRFTLWDWLCGAKNLLKEYPNLCRERLIHGFLTKDRAEDLLKLQPEGTFLMRFSHTFLDGKTNPFGGLSVVVSSWNTRKGKMEMLHSKPFSHRKCERVDPLPKEKTFGLWMENFASKASDNKETNVKSLCGQGTIPLIETFKNYMLREDTEELPTYVSVNKKIIIGDGSAMIGQVLATGKDYDDIQGKILEILALANIPSGNDLLLKAPVPLEPQWRVFAFPQQDPMDDQSSVTTSSCNGASPMAVVPDDCMHTTPINSPLSECLSMPEDRGIAGGELQTQFMTFNSDDIGAEQEIFLESLNLSDPIMTIAANCFIPGALDSKPGCIPADQVHNDRLPPIDSVLVDSNLHEWMPPTCIPATVESMET